MNAAGSACARALSATATTTMTDDYIGEEEDEAAFADPDYPF